MVAPAPSAKVTHQRWGLKDALLTVIAALLVQAVAAVGFIAYWAANNSSTISETTTPNAVISEVITGPVLLISSILMYAVWAGGLWNASYRRGLRSFRRDYWLKFRKQDIFIGLVVATVMRLLEFGVTSGLDATGVDLSGSDNASLIVSLEGVWYFVNAILIAAIAAPFIEEVLFRGLILQSFLRMFRRARFTSEDASPTGVTLLIRNFLFKHGNMLALVFSSALFGVMHFQGFETFGQIFVVLWTGTLGFLLGLLTYKYKRLGPAIWAHIFFNFSGVILSTIF